MKPAIALTVIQPWAWAIAAGLKTIENRPWRTNHRGTIYIHAGRKVSNAEFYSCQERLRASRACVDMPSLSSLPTGALIATADILDCGRFPDDPWANPSPEMWHWRLGNVRILAEPEPMRGQLGLWRVS